MEAGYDYLLMRGRLQRRFFNFSGIFVIFLGALLLAASGGYYAYATAARGGLEELNAFGQPESQPLANVTPSSQPPYRTAAQSPPQRAVNLSDNGSGFDIAGPTARAPQGLLTFQASAISDQRLYPGEVITPHAWGHPASYEPASYIEELELRGFTPLAVGEPLPNRPAATRILIPSIGIDSPVNELDILDLAGSRFYETPANTVGHIPESGNAGEANSAWFFGHTESPLSGEGSVFYNLTQVPGKINSGEDVFIVTENGQDRFLYRVTSTTVIHQSELTLFDTGQASIHLVSCVPRLVYDHRLVVNGELVAQQ